MAKNKTLWLIGVIIMIMILTNSDMKKEAGGDLSRVMSSQAYYGEEMEVTIRGSYSGDYFAIFKETLPSGWQYVSGAGTEDGKVKGYVTSLLNNEHRYKVMPPQDANSTSVFDGSYKLAGSSTWTDMADTTVSVVPHPCSVRSDCPSDTACKAWTCSGVCRYTPSASVCEVGGKAGTCSSGVCGVTGGTRLRSCRSDSDCNDGNSCTTEVCTTIGKCSITKLKDGDSCGGSGTCKVEGESISCIAPQTNYTAPVVDCSAWQEQDGNKCVTAQWVYIIGIFVGGIILLRTIMGG